MALTTCKECGKELSDRAYICPHCGIKLRQTNADVLITLIFIALAALLFFIKPFLAFLAIPLYFIFLLSRILK